VEAAISMSLGLCEPDLTGQMEYVRALNNLFAVAAGAGISVIAATGDSGAALCANGATVLPQLSVAFPASSTWVTAVGGTNLELDSKNRIRREFVWNEGSVGPMGAGGGQSILATTRPWYQQGTTRFRGYGLTRALPDVSALSDLLPGYSVYCTATGPGGCAPKSLPKGGWQSVGGTSAAAPLVASMLTLVSQRLARSNRKPLGLVNPLLYRLGRSKARRSVFRDVVAGDNDVGPAIPKAVGGGTRLGCCYTKPGFDLASGWGSIKTMGLVKAALRTARRR